MIEKIFFGTWFLMMWGAALLLAWMGFDHHLLISIAASVLLTVLVGSGAWLMLIQE
jgi:hypothetical protein